MGLFDKLIGRRKKEATANVQNPIQQQPANVSPPPQPQVDTKIIEGINQRLTSIENEVNRLNMSFEASRRSVSEVKEDVEGLKENVKMVVSLYEMVSKEFNPFIDQTPEEIKDLTDSLRENVEDLRSLVNSAIKDLKELYGAPDMDSILTEIEQEESNDQ